MQTPLCKFPKPVRALLLATTVIGAAAGQPQLKVLRTTIDPYPVESGISNCVITVYKASSLGTVYSPFKPCALFPATRTNISILVLPGTYRFQARASGKQGEQNLTSEPSNTVTNIVRP